MAHLEHGRTERWRMSQWMLTRETSPMTVVLLGSSYVESGQVYQTEND